MTGVPAPDEGTSDSLFNFDYVQIGTTSPVDLFGGVFRTFNHFLVDAMTITLGTIRVGSENTPLAGAFNDDLNAPPELNVPEKYVVSDPRVGDECTNGGNTDGVNSMSSKFCAYNTAVKIGNETDLGIYMLRNTVFDIQYNGEQTRQDWHCGQFGENGLFVCGTRTIVELADTVEIEASYYADGGLGAELTRTKTTLVTNAPGLSTAVDRSDGTDGVCSRAVATRGGLAVRMDAADGSVPDSCIINGIF